MKICKKCKENLTEDSFHKDKNTKDKLSCYCKNCKKLLSKKYKWSNLNDIQREKRKLSQYKYKEKNKSTGLCIRCKSEALNNSNLCEIDYLKAKSIQFTGSVENYKLIKEKLEQQNYLCKYSNKKIILGVNASLDHILPKSRYPEKEKDPNNLVWVDTHINIMKNNMSYEEFVDLCKLVLKHN